MELLQILYDIQNKYETEKISLSIWPWENIKSAIVNKTIECCDKYRNSDRMRVLEKMTSILETLNVAISCKDDAKIHILLGQIICIVETLPHESCFVDSAIEYMDEYVGIVLNSARNRHEKNNTIIVMGDSHTNFFSGNENLSFIGLKNNVDTCINVNDLPFSILHCGPCLAYTCNKEDSLNMFKKKADWCLSSFVKKGARIVVSLGEIDIRVHVLLQSEKQNRSYEEILDDVMDQYMIFLLGLKQKGYEVYVWGPIASQITKCEIDPNFPRFGSEMDRNKATEYFTNKMLERCSDKGIGFMSIFKNMITEGYLTKAEYLSDDNCHLSQRALPLAIEEWKRLKLI